MVRRMSKRVAIECRALVGPRAGIGRYLYRLLEEFAGRKDDVTYYLYAPRLIEVPEVCLADPRFVVRMVHFRPALLWLHAVVPLWIAQDRIDVFFGPNYAAPLLRLHDYRSVITIHDAVYARFPETMLLKTLLHNRFMLPLYCRHADLLLTDSHFSAQELHEIIGIEDDKLRVVHLAGNNHVDMPTDSTVTVGQPDVAAQSRIAGSYILTVGTVEPRKNMESVVAAYAMLPTALREAYSIVIIGRTLWGGLNPQQWFEEYGVTGHAFHFDDVSDGELQGFFSQASLFVFASLYEGFGLPVVEAMSCGVPVICSYTSSLAEAAGGAALLCDPTSPQDLSTKVELVLQDIALKDTLIELGTRRVTDLTWARTARATLHCILGEE